MSLDSTASPPLHHVVIVGGGAGGLELATRLGDTLGRKGKAHITLIDRNRTHVWKPLLHEIAAGSMKPCCITPRPSPISSSLALTLARPVSHALIVTSS